MKLSLRTLLNVSRVELLGDVRSIPGFRITAPNVLWVLPLCYIHIDLNARDRLFYHEMDIYRQYAGAQITHCPGHHDEYGVDRFSFTLPLSLPDEGGIGLKYLSFDIQKKPVLQKELYEVGRMVVHRGRLWHQIGDWNYESRGDALRITLQGFGFVCDDMAY